MHSSKSGFGGWLTDNCYMFFSVLAFLSFYYGIPDIIRLSILLLVFLINLRYVKRGNIHSVVIFYILAAFFSLTGYLIRPYPPVFFATVFYWSYMPIIFYFVGTRSHEDYPVFYRRSLWAFMFIFIVGFYFLLFPTERYVSKTLEILNLHSGYNEDTYMYARFASFLDSYHTSNLGVCSLCFGFGLARIGSNGKTITKVLAYLAIVVSLITIMMAQQRVAMFVGVFLLVYFLLSGKGGKHTGSLLLTMLIIGVLLVLVVGVMDTFGLAEVLLPEISQRFSSDSTSSMVSIRTHQWVEAIDGFFQEPLFGLGIGSGGHLAVGVNMHPSVADGSYFKILLEGGLASFIPFIIILVSSLIKGFKQRKKYYVEFPLLFFFSCSMIGANVIDMPYIIMFMWYIMGRINSNSSRKQIAVNNNGQQ